MKIKKQIILTENELKVIQNLRDTYNDSPLYEDCESFGGFINSIAYENCGVDYGYEVITEKEV